mmetsp:Transcript_51269/g.127665  ORF Transcript_51269/g.127665 Transcript_51269/m.127665 type:complete len:207 (-) Transcript_51269:379-999(-)
MHGGPRIEAVCRGGARRPAVPKGGGQGGVGFQQEGGHQPLLPPGRHRGRHGAVPRAERAVPQEGHQGDGAGCAEQGGDQGAVVRSCVPASRRQVQGRQEQGLCPPLRRHPLDQDDDQQERRQAGQGPLLAPLQEARVSHPRPDHPPRRQPHELDAPPQPRVLGRVPRSPRAVWRHPPRGRHRGGQQALHAPHGGRLCPRDLPPHHG